LQTATGAVLAVCKLHRGAGPGRSLPAIPANSRSARSKLCKRRSETLSAAADAQSGAVALFRQAKLTCFIHLKEDMEGVIHILLALAIMLLVERLIQAGNV